VFSNSAATPNVHAAASGRPVVSVVMPCYNASLTIRRALHSLMAQDLSSSYEVLVVDSSTDGTDAIVQEEFPQVRLLRLEARTPPGAARNAGVRQAQGNIIAFLDADCVADRSWLRHLISPYEADIAGVGGSVANGNPASLVGWASFLIEFSRLAPSLAPRPVADVVTCNCSFKRQVFEECGYFHEGDFFAEDMLFSRRLAQAGERLLFEPRALVYHENREGLREFLRHMRRLGEGVGVVRLSDGMPHACLSRYWWLAAVAYPYRVGRIAWRALRGYLRDAWRLPLVMPLVAAGFLAFSWGELGARGATMQERRKTASSGLETGWKRSDS
jgi:glycosyltransferase involved in cell wall biosynthesis